MRYANALLRGEREVLFRVPSIGFAETVTLFDDSLHRNNLTADGQPAKRGGGEGEKSLLPSLPSVLTGERRTEGNEGSEVS